MEKYCVTCHNERAKTGGLVLENLDPQSTSGNPELWEKVVLKLRGGMHGAAQWGLTDVVKFLHAQGANINAPDRRGLTPLDHAEGRAGGFGFDGKAGVTRDATAKAIRELGGKEGTPTGDAIPERRANGAQDDTN